MYTIVIMLIGNAINRIDCYYQNLYSIYGKYYNSTIRTEALKLVGNIEACNCNFNIEQAVKTCWICG